MTSYKRQFIRRHARKLHRNWWRKLLGLPAPRRKPLGHKPDRRRVY